MKVQVYYGTKDSSFSNTVLSNNILILCQVHGGTNPSDIVKKVRQAEEIAIENTRKYKHMDTVLFFDEANTTEAIGVIKEIMCDKSLEGKPMNLHHQLKIVAACNPYRKYVYIHRISCNYM